MMIGTGQRSRQRTHGREGSALVLMTFATAALAGLSIALLSVSQSGAREQRGSKEGIHARYIAEAGISAALFDIDSGGTGNLGTAAPVTWGGASYVVTRTDVAVGEALPLIRLESTGVEDRAGSRVEVVLRQVQSSIFTWAAFGDEFLSMDSNAQVDSYDSSIGTYASQATHGSGSSQHADETGDIGSNGNVTAKSNVKVWGDAIAGPGSTTTVVGNAQVSGSTAPALEPMELPEIDLPSIAHASAWTVNGSQSLPAGDHGYSTLRINGTLTVTGPARLVIGSYRITSNAKFLVNAANGPVEIWVIDDFLINSNTLMASLTKRPADLRINLLSDNVISPETNVDLDEVDFDSNAKLYGTLYAPSAAIEVDSNFELFGSLVARNVDLDSNCKIHYDQALATAPGPGAVSYQVVSWRPLPFDP